MKTTTEAARIYLIRHATPDWTRTDIPYDIPPGPALTQAGEAEAVQVGEFLHQAGVKKLYHSPFERARCTARIAATAAGIPLKEAPAIAELRIDEPDPEYMVKLLPFWNQVVEESCQGGPIGLVSHGGPVRILLLMLGLTPGQVEEYNQRFDGKNPLPPAGVWLAERERDQWSLKLVFVPYHAYGRSTTYHDGHDGHDGKTPQNR